MSLKKLLLGNEALARGAYEAGVRVAAAYPGTPSTEILESLARYPEVYAEWSVNEKVALDLAFGASLGGARTLCSMKHVGLNVAADALMTIAYTGVGAGLVIIVADDPGLHSSQNEQDSRYYAKFAAIPMLEPADGAEAKDFVKAAFEISERYDTPVMVRVTTRLSHSRGLVPLAERMEFEREPVKKEPEKHVMVPAYAAVRHRELFKRLEALKQWAEETELNRVEACSRWLSGEGKTAVGIIAAGLVYQYAKEILPDASFFKLGVTYPLPEARLRAFARQVKRVIVIEELEPFLEEQLRSYGIDVRGKEFFPRTGELDLDLVEAGLVRAGVIPPRSVKELAGAYTSVVSRPPVLCSGCGHRQVFYALKRLNARVFGDIGCYTLAALPPLNSLHTTISMGSSIANAMGFVKAAGSGHGVVAVIGDSTFLHGGMPALLNVVYNQAAFTTIILDNATVGMTGGQDTPGTGITAQGEKTVAADIAAICRALGVEKVFEIDCYDYQAVYNLIKRELKTDQPTVIIARHPCVLRYPEPKPAFSIVAEKCIGCKVCLVIGCPAIALSNTQFTEKGKARAIIDPMSCTAGCELCAIVCPVPGCIIPLEKED